MDTNALRVLVEAVDREMSRTLAPPHASAAEPARRGALGAAWGRLVAFLALGPAPELRECPHCGASGMRAATRCGHCWNALVPPAPHAAASLRP